MTVSNLILAVFRLFYNFIIAKCYNFVDLAILPRGLIWAIIINVKRPPELGNRGERNGCAKPDTDHRLQDLYAAVRFLSHAAQGIVSPFCRREVVTGRVNRLLSPLFLCPILASKIHQYTTEGGVL